MANISISCLYSSDSESLLTCIDYKGRTLIKSAVNRALEVRGGGPPTSSDGDPPRTGKYLYLLL
jgi:hypothetical protein